MQFRIASLTLAGMALLIGFGMSPATAQQGSLTFKNFKSYPTGQWSSEMTTYRDDVPLAPPQTSTRCSSPLDDGTASRLKKLGNDAAPTCKIKPIVDTEKLVEFEQVCSMGTFEQIMHTTIRAVDDRQVALETRMSVPGQSDRVTRIQSKLLGPCPPGAAEADAPSNALVNHPSAEDCAGIPEMRKGIADLERQCGEAPESFRATCLAQTAASRKVVASMEQRCKVGGQHAEP